MQLLDSSTSTAGNWGLRPMREREWVYRYEATRAQGRRVTRDRNAPAPLSSGDFLQRASPFKFWLKVHSTVDLSTLFPQR